MSLVDTPIEKYQLEDGQHIFVKREDLCCPSPGPPFSKIRGVFRGIAKLKSEGVEVVSYVESKISMASWGVAWACNQLGEIKAIIYMPNYKVGIPPLLDYHRRQWESLGAETRLIHNPNRGQINAHRARKELKTEFGDKAILLPMGLPFVETLEETALQVQLINPVVFGCVTACVGSGVVCSGLIKGLASSIKGYVGLKKPVIVYGIAIRHFDHPEKKRAEILSRSGALGGLLYPTVDFRFINTDYEYLDFEQMEPPFPCNPYYDRKAWRWVVENYDKLEKPVLYWNIGAGGLYDQKWI